MFNLNLKPALALPGLKRLLPQIGLKLEREGGLLSIS